MPVQVSTSDTWETVRGLFHQLQPITVLAGLMLSISQFLILLKVDVTSMIGISQSSGGFIKAQSSYAFGK